MNGLPNIQNGKGKSKYEEKAKTQAKAG